MIDSPCVVDFLKPCEPVLSAEESLRLQQLEAVIDFQVGMIGAALVEIQERQLYRQDYRTFEQYCSQRWRYTRTWAYGQIGAWKARKNLSTMVDMENLPGPVNERQLRPLVVLEPDQQGVAWKRAYEIAGSDKITNVHVKQAVAEIRRDKEAASPKRRLNQNFDAQNRWDKIEEFLKREMKAWPQDQQATLHQRLKEFLAGTFQSAS